jgi:UDP-N-acetylmuramoylalanine-D-glutamate ligase
MGPDTAEAPLIAAGRKPRPPLPPGPYLVIGLGKAGFAAARALAETAGPAAVRAWDGAADAAQLERSAELRRLGVEVQLGGDGLSVLAGVRTVVKSPGVPFEIPLVAEALRRGLRLLDELEIGWQLVPVLTLGVTGTKGKTTTSFLAAAMLRGHGFSPALSGNTNFGPALSELVLGEPPDSVVAEVSSFQAELATALAVDAAAFTNLSPDHRDRYEDMGAYADAKRRLFLREDWCVPLAAFNADDAVGRRLAREVRERGGSAVTYGTTADADYRIVRCRWDVHRTEVVFEAPSGPIELETPLIGLHNAANAAAVLALADGLGLPQATTLEALAVATPPPGRLELLDLEAPFRVVVDLANVPDSVAKVLGTARELLGPDGRLLTVQSVMSWGAPFVGQESGRKSRELSDHLVLTAASYRGEPRLLGLSALVSGARAVSGGEMEAVIDRRKAIARVLSLAREGDVVAILGRGWVPREATDERGGFREFDDRQVVRELLS